MIPRCLLSITYKSPEQSTYIKELHRKLIKGTGSHRMIAPADALLCVLYDMVETYSLLKQTCTL